MPTASVARSDVFPVGTTVGIYPATAQRDGGPPSSAAIATGVVDGAGALSVTNAGILSLTAYVAYALVSGEHRYLRVRSTLDVSATAMGIGSGTGNTTSGSADVTSAAAASGSFQVGQRISGPGIPAGARIKKIVGGTLTLTEKATATAVGVALQAEHAGGWRAQLMRRRDLIGTAND